MTIKLSVTLGYHLVMELIPFPYSYKQALNKRSKNMTIRIGSEVGKYQAGKIYVAGTYGGKEWGIKIEILKVTRIEPQSSDGANGMNTWQDLGILKQTVEKVVKAIRQFKYPHVIEIIEFEYC